MDFLGFVGKWLGNIRITQVGGVLYNFSSTKYIYHIVLALLRGW